MQIHQTGATLTIIFYTQGSISLAIFSLRIQVQLNLPFALILIVTNSAQQNFPKNIITFFRSWHVQNVVLTRWSGMIIQVQQKVVSTVLEL